MKKMNVLNFIPQIISIAKKHKDVWIYLSHQDLNSQFRRSKLGILWLVINQLSFSIGAGLIWAAVFGLNPLDFIPFISAGFAIWGLITASFVDSCATFHNAQGFIKQVPLPMSVYVIRNYYTSAVRFSIGISVAFLVVLFFGKLSITGLLYFIPGLFLVLLLSFLIANIFSYIGVMYQDIQHGLGNLFQLLFVLTPVIYPPEVLIKKGLGFAVYLNPLTSIIQILRSPLVEQKPAHIIEYFFVVGYIILAMFIASKVKERIEKKVIYYL